MVAEKIKLAPHYVRKTIPECQMFRFWRWVLIFCLGWALGAIFQSSQPTTTPTSMEPSCLHGQIKSALISTPSPTSLNARRVNISEPLWIEGSLTTFYGSGTIAESYGRFSHQDSGKSSTGALINTGGNNDIN